MKRKTSHLTAPQDVSALFVGLDATPTGSNAADIVVADFTGATEISTGASIVGPSPVQHFPSQTQGSRFEIQVRGLWLVTAMVIAQTAAAVRAGLSFNGVAADFNVDPVPNARTLDVGLSISAGLDTVPIKLSAVVAVTPAMIDNPAGDGNVRLLLSDNAAGGAAAAALDLTLATLRFVRIADLPA